VRVQDLVDLVVDFADLARHQSAASSQRPLNESASSRGQGSKGVGPEGNEGVDAQPGENPVGGRKRVNDECGVLVRVRPSGMAGT
jgi:hypothetical protein